MCIDNGVMQMTILKSYGFFSYRKAESIAFVEEKSSAITIGTNPGFQNGVLVIYEDVYIPVIPQSD